MTDLVYFSKHYKGYQKSDNLIRNVDIPIINSLINSAQSTDLFVYSTWFEIDEELTLLLSKNPKRAIIYSGMDWHDYGFRKDVHDYIKSKVDNIVYVGNTDGPGYFSYWLFFIEKYFKKYSTQDLIPLQIEHMYMCLNRKRHEHRVELVEKLEKEYLLDKGLVSLGGDLSANIPPVLLKNDVSNLEGDNSVANPIEGISNDISTLGNLHNWNNHLINVVTETTHFSTTFISEKTWKPIIGLRPFIILGDRYIYSYLQEYGIDTFDDIFGTGYKEDDYRKRIEWVVTTLKKFENIDLLSLFNQLLPRLVSNREKMEEIFKVNHTRYEKVLKNLGRS